MIASTSVVLPSLLKRTKRRSRTLPLHRRIDDALLFQLAFENREIRLPDLTIREHR